MYFFFCRFRQLQSKHESRLSEIQNELKIKMFEAERSQMVYAETVKNLGTSEMEIEKLQKKIEVWFKHCLILKSDIS